jgi:hypothetical protein
MNKEYSNSYLNQLKNYQENSSNLNTQETSNQYKQSSLMSKNASIPAVTTTTHAVNFDSFKTPVRPINHNLYNTGIASKQVRTPDIQIKKFI